MMARRPSWLGTFHHQPFLAYWLAGLAANFGWQIQIVGASWLMLSLGASAQLVALVQASVAMPVMLLSLPGGALSDIVGQRAVILWSQTFLVAVSCGLAAGAYLGVLAPATLLLCTFLFGCGRAVYYPGWQSMVLELVPRAEAPQAVALNSSNMNVARSCGPALGGAIISLAGVFLAFVLSGLSNLCVIAVARTWPRGRSEGEVPSETIGGAMLAGIRFVAYSPELMRITLRSAAFNFAAIAVLALLPLVARDFLQGGPQTFGVLLAMFGIGAIAGAFILGALRQRFRLDAIIAVGAIAYALGTSALALSHALLPSLIGAALCGVSWTVIQVTLNAAVQVSSPRWVLSRSNAIYQSVAFGANALGSLAFGSLADAGGVSLSLLVCAGLVVAGAIAGRLFAIGEPADALLDRMPHQISPPPTLPLHRDDGPIVTTIHYRIDDADLPRFLDAMKTKRQFRLRDGASRWSLSRDIHDPNLWFERYRVATWAEAQRLHWRRTAESAELYELVRRLHRGSEPQEAHYTLVYPSSRSGGLPPGALPRLEV